MTKRKIMFIYNPVSGLLQHYNIPKQIDKYIDYNKFDVTINKSEYAGHSTVLAKEASEQGYDIVVAIGGDGSINEVVNGIVNTNTQLAIIPMGSGNGFANHLKIPPRNFKECIRIINFGKSVKIDLAKTNTKYGYFVSVGGFGFEALAVQRFKEQPLRGFLSYTIAIIRQYFLYDSIQKTRVHIDSKILDRDIFIFTVFNSNQYGYNIGFTNNSSLNDGVLEIVMVKKFIWYRLFWNMFILMMRKPHWSKDVEYFKGFKIKVEKVDNFVIQIDGDPFVIDHDFEIEVAPSSLNMIINKRNEKY
jgi:YegS/Rv2252/BmrU family lipid kinase